MDLRDRRFRRPWLPPNAIPIPYMRDMARGSPSLFVSLWLPLCLGRGNALRPFDRLFEVYIHRPWFRILNRLELVVFRFYFGERFVVRNRAGVVEEIPVAQFAEIVRSSDPVTHGQRLDSIALRPCFRRAALVRARGPAPQKLTAPSRPAKRSCTLFNSPDYKLTGSAKAARTRDSGQAAKRDSLQAAGCRCILSHAYSDRAETTRRWSPHTATLNLIPSFGACTRSCFVPR